MAVMKRKSAVAAAMTMMTMATMASTGMPWSPKPRTHSAAHWQRVRGGPCMRCCCSSLAGMNAASWVPARSAAMRLMHHRSLAECSNAIDAPQKLLFVDSGLVTY